MINLNFTYVRVDSTPHEMIAKLEALANDPAAFPGEKANAAAMAKKLREKHGITGPVNLGGGGTKKHVKNPGSHGGHFYGFDKHGNPKYGSPHGPKQSYGWSKHGSGSAGKTKWKGNRVGQTSSGRGIYDWYMPREDYTSKDHEEAASFLRGEAKMYKEAASKKGATSDKAKQYEYAANMHDQAAKEKAAKAGSTNAGSAGGQAKPGAGAKPSGGTTFKKATVTQADLDHAQMRATSFMAKGMEKGGAKVSQRTKSTNNPVKLAAWYHVLSGMGLHDLAVEALTKLQSKGYTA